MTANYFIQIDLANRQVLKVGARPDGFEPEFTSQGSPSPSRIVYTVDGGKVLFKIHWLTQTPLYFHRRGSLNIAATCLTDIARNAPLRSTSHELTRLLSGPLRDGPGDPMFQNIVVAFPQDAATVDLNTGEIVVIPPADARDADAIPLNEGEIEEALIEAIRVRIGQASKCAFAISGGVDSTTLAALGRRLVGRNLLCFTARTHGGDDLRFATIAARDLGADLRIVDVPVDKKALALHASAVNASCQPIAFTGNSIGFGAICRAARAEGVDMIVDGTGGDPIFGGSYLLHGVPWAWSLGVDRTSKQFEEFVTAFKLAGHTSSKALDSILKDELPPADFSVTMRNAITRGGMARWRSHHVANARAHGVAIAMPYLSADVARFLWSEPMSFFENGWNKAPLRRVLAKYVSDEVAWRRSDQGLRWPASPFFEANRAAMRRKLLFSNMSRISPRHWMAASLGRLSDSRLVRTYSAATAALAASELWRNRLRTTS